MLSTMQTDTLHQDTMISHTKHVLRHTVLSLHLSIPLQRISLTRPHSEQLEASIVSCVLKPQMRTFTV